MSPASRANKAAAELTSAESELRDALLRLLPHGVERGVDFFTNSEHYQHPLGIVRLRSDNEMLLAAARRCVELRASQGMPATDSLAKDFLAACEELAGADAHRRGPRRLAEAVLARAQRSDA